MQSSWFFHQLFTVLDISYESVNPVFKCWTHYKHWRRSEFLRPPAGHTCRCEASLDEIWNALFVEKNISRNQIDTRVFVRIAWSMLLKNAKEKRRRRTSFLFSYFSYYISSVAWKWTGIANNTPNRYSPCITHILHWCWSKPNYISVYFCK